MSNILKCASSALLLTIVSGTLLSGCSVLEGSGEKKATSSNEAAPAAPVEVAYVYVPDSGQIPLPLISPRHATAPIVAATGTTAPNATAGKPVPAVPISASMGAMAAAYVKYEKALEAAEKSKLATPTEVRKVLKDLRFAQPAVLTQGWYAARASIAMQNAKFVAGVKEEVSDKGQDKVLAALDNSNYVLSLPGAGDAMNDVSQTELQQSTRIKSLKKRFLDTSMKFQKQKKWGMLEPQIQETTPEMTPIKQADASRGMTFTSILAEFSPITPAEAFSQVAMTRILSLAARQIINAPATSALLTEDETTTCLNWARLNLNQCIAAAHFPSEEAWCTGTHGVGDVGACWAKIVP